MSYSDLCSMPQRLHSKLFTSASIFRLSMESDRSLAVRRHLVAVIIPAPKEALRPTFNKSSVERSPMGPRDTKAN